MSERERILFVTSNGTGLGHLTRSMAIARRLDPSLEPLVITLSAAAPVVRAQGFAVEYVASHATPTSGSDLRWEQRLRGRVRAAIAEARPRVLVFDGAHPWPRLIEAMGVAPEMTTVWCRRPMWRPGSNPGAIERESRFDAVLEPGEFAAPLDRGATVARREHARLVDPIVFLDREELEPRERAERELGLDSGKLNVLVQLGQGPELRAALERCLRHLASRRGVQVAALESAIADLGSVPEGVVHLRSSYPISRHYAAFDLAVSAAGYNAYHELLRFGVPSLFLAMPRQTDDQAARARYAQQTGVGMGLEEASSAELEPALERMLDPAVREAMRARLEELCPANGAPDAAAWIAELAASPPHRPERRPGPGSRSRRKSVARSSGTRVLALLRAGAPFAVQTVRRPSARTVVFALGVDRGELEAGLRRVLGEVPDPPERVLVITDSLELRMLRHAGVGFEHVPAPGELQPRLAGGDYHEFRRRRVALIMAARPRARRALAIGSVDPELLELVTAPSRARNELLDAHPTATLGG